MNSRPAPPAIRAIARARGLMRVAEHAAKDARTAQDPAFIMRKAQAELNVGALQEASRQADAVEARALIALFTVDPESFSVLTPDFLDDAEDALHSLLLRITEDREEEK